MTRQDAIPYVFLVVDTALCGRNLGDDVYAIIRQNDFKYPSRLIGWECDEGPVFVAVHGYCDMFVTDEEAEELALDFLTERGRFSGESRPADYLL